MDLVRTPSRKNIARFLVARFARLYPLFFLVLVADVVFGWKAEDFPSFWYYLSFTQSWVYVLFDDRSLLSHFRTAAVSWSISTEWFLYLCYPAIAWLMLRFGLRALIGIVLIHSGLLGACYLFPALIDYPALHLWGPVAVDRSNGNSLFYAWVLNYSPFGRVQEFMSGMVACQIFISRRLFPASSAECRFGLTLLAGALALLLSIYAGLQMAGGTRYYAIIAAVSPCAICASVGSIVFASPAIVRSCRG